MTTTNQQPIDLSHILDEHSLDNIVGYHVVEIFNDVETVVVRYDRPDRYAEAFAVAQSIRQSANRGWARVENVYVCGHTSGS